MAYPLGLTAARSPAASPLPGHLLATLGPAGHAAAIALLLAAGVALVASLKIAPPATPAAAARRVALGLTALFRCRQRLASVTSSYPISLYAWAMLADRQGGTGPRRFRRPVEPRPGDRAASRQVRALGCTGSSATATDGAAGRCRTRPASRCR